MIDLKYDGKSDCYYKNKRCSSPELLLADIVAILRLTVVTEVTIHNLNVLSIPLTMRKILRILSTQLKYRIEVHLGWGTLSQRMEAASSHIMEEGMDGNLI